MNSDQIELTGKREAGVLFRKGRQLFKTKRFREAIALFEKALERDPENIFIRTALADSLRRLKNFREAALNYEKALKLAPEDAFALVGMGECLRSLKDFSQAGECYQKVLAKEPDNLYALRGMGDAYQGRKRLELALEYWQRYVDLRPEDVFVLTRLGDALKNLGRFQQAENVYLQTLEVDAEDHYAQMGLADLYQKTGQDSLAIRFYEQVLEKRPRLVNILTIVGNLRWDNDEQEKARTCYEKVLALDSRNSYALYGLGRYYRWRRDYPKAIEFWERILETEPGTVSMLTRLGDAYRNIGNLAGAETSYRQSLESGYDKFGMLGLAKLYAIRGEISEARMCYEELLKREEEDGMLFRTILSQVDRSRQAEFSREFYSAAQKVLSDQGNTLQKIKGQIESVCPPNFLS